MHLPVPSTSVAFTVFGVDIMWYALCLTSGIVLGGFLGYKRAKRYGFPEEKYLDLLIYSVPAAVIGARLFYVLFEWDYYSKHLAQIFHFRGGGLAIHGGLIGGLLVGYLFLRKNKISVIRTFDMVAPCLALGQAIGRWGNYFNQEAHGVATDLPWGIWIEAEQQYVHPTFLYESLWCFLLVLFLCLVVTKRQKFDGQVFLLYVILYSIERFFVEGLRTDSLMLGSLRQAQVFSILAVIFCGILYVIGRRKE